MAKTAKSHHGRAKPVKHKVAVAKGKKKVHAAAKHNKAPAKKSLAAPEPELKKSATAKGPGKTAAAVPGDKKKGPGNGMFARPAMRRGRRPKALADYQPNNNEEEETNQDLDYRGLEYDTGIRVAKPKDDNPFNMERFDDYDEELNFDF